MQEIIKELNFIETKNFLVKVNIRRMRRSTINWEKIFVKDTSDKRTLKLTQELSNSIIEIKNNLRMCQKL